MDSWITPIKDVRRKYNMYRDKNYVYQHKQGIIFRSNITTHKKDQIDMIPDQAIPSQYTVTGALIPENTEAFQQSKSWYYPKKITLTDYFYLPLLKLHF